MGAVTKTHRQAQCHLLSGVPTCELDGETWQVLMTLSVWRLNTGSRVLCDKHWLCSQGLCDCG